MPTISVENPPKSAKHGDCGRAVAEVSHGSSAATDLRSSDLAGCLIRRDDLPVHLAVPLFAIIIAVISQYSGLDIWLSRHFYDAELSLWPYRSFWLTSNVLHTGGKYFIVFIFLTIILALLLSHVVNSLSKYRKDLVYLLIASLSGIAIVGILKNMTHIYSPWDLIQFGGGRPHIRLFDALPAGAPVGHAFPAGHASGAFAFFSIYFLLRKYNSSYRYYGLAFPLILGSAYGLAQQMRGAHFLSHDLFSLAICWSCALAWSFAFYGKEHAPSLR